MHWTELERNVVCKCIQIQAWRAACCRGMKTQCGDWLTPPAWSVWPPAQQMGLCGFGTPIIPHRVCLFSTRRKVRRRPCEFGLVFFPVCPSHSFPLCLSEHGTPTSVAFVNTDPSQVVVSFDGGETLLYDLNTEQSIMVLETQTKDGKPHHTGTDI